GFPIGPEDKAGAVFGRAARAAVELLDDVLPEPAFNPQPDEGIIYADKITAADRELDLSGPAKEVHDRVRALSTHIGARGVVGGRPVLAWCTIVAELKLEEREDQLERQV